MSGSPITPEQAAELHQQLGTSDEWGVDQASFNVAQVCTAARGVVAAFIQMEQTGAEDISFAVEADSQHKADMAYAIGQEIGKHFEEHLGPDEILPALFAADEILRTISVCLITPSAGYLESTRRVREVQSRRLAEMDLSDELREVINAAMGSAMNHAKAIHNEHHQED